MQYGIAGAKSKLFDDKWHFIVAEFNSNNTSVNKLWIDSVPQTLAIQRGSIVNRPLASGFDIALS